MNWNFFKNLLFFKKIRLTSFGRTDTGKKRKRNEDNFAILAHHNLFIVADGMGGHKAGDVASENAINILADYLIEHRINKMAGRQMEIRHTLTNGFVHTNEEIIKMAQGDEDLSNMGCTMIACFVDRHHIHFCHVGDVRGYVSHNDSFDQLTSDHSYAAQYQQMNNSELKVPAKNIVSQAIGFPFKDGPEYQSIESHPKSRVVICSDGLWGMLEDNKLQEIINSSSSPEDICDQFIDQANEAGGKDNITAVTVLLP